MDFKVVEFGAPGDAFLESFGLDLGAPGAASRIGYAQVFGNRGNLNGLALRLLLECGLHSRAGGDPRGLFKGNLQPFIIKELEKGREQHAGPWPQPDAGFFHRNQPTNCPPTCLQCQLLFG